MPRKVALLAVLASLALAAPASADVVTNNDPGQVAAALADPLGSPSADFSARPEVGDPSGVGSGPLGGFPTSGATYGVLSTGDADYFTTGTSTSNPSTESQIEDLVTLVVTVDVPENRNCLRLDFRFFSNEQKGDSTFTDTFLAELGDSSITIDGETGEVEAPLDFAFQPDGHTSVTSAAFAEGDTGTRFTGATPLMTASTPITPGRHSVYLSIFDRDDAIVDSAVILDAMRLEATGACGRGAAPAIAPDRAAPAVSIGAPANGSTITGAPTYSGTAGDAPGDNPQVTVRTTSSSGQTVEAVATRAGAGWSVPGAALAPGAYTAVAIQGDAAGNVGQSAPVTFTVAATPPPDELDPPVTGKAVNVSVVKGKVRIRRPGGKFVTLDDPSQIPTGSTVDTRSGTVELVSTAKGGKTQKARFFQGMFKVTQSRGKNPLTNLKLNEPLAKCKKATTSQRRKKRKRRLWGNGRGNFRTSGRRSAATVTGTKWLVEDSCKGTLTRVARGTVKVRDYKKKKTIKVKAGKKYMAR